MRQPDGGERLVRFGARLGRPVAAHVEREAPILGIIVGTIIVAQTLYSSTKDHLKEFATLRAIGSARRYILKVILAQALISAVVGFSIAVSIDLSLVKMTRDAALPIVMSPELSVGLLALTIVMCAIAAMAAIRVVTRIDPVLVFAQ